MARVEGPYICPVERGPALIQALCVIGAEDLGSLG